MSETEVEKKHKKKRIWRTSSSLVSLELKWRDEEYKKYLVRCENIWKTIKARKKYYREYDHFVRTNLVDAIGPIWYQELSNPQRDALDSLALMMHMDIGQGTPERTLKVLQSLGILPMYKKCIVMNALYDSKEDPSLFFRELYNSVYELDPTEELDNYILEQKLIISAIVYLNIHTFIKSLNELTKYSVPPSSPKPKPLCKEKSIPAKSVYLEDQPFIPLISTEMYSSWPQPKPPLPLPDDILKKFGLLSDDENSSLTESLSTKSVIFDKKNLAKGGRGVKNMKDKNNKNNSELQQLSPLPQTNETKSPLDIYDCCGDNCECVKWYPAIIKYLQEKKRREAEEKLKQSLNKSKSKLKDLKSKGKSKKTDDKKRTKEGIEKSGKSKKTKKSKQKPLVERLKYSINECDFLKELIEELQSMSYIAHLPDLCRLPILQEWARKRLQGELSWKEREKFMRSSGANWTFLMKEPLKAKPDKLPFSNKDLFSMTWDKRSQINRLVSDLHTKFEKKVRRKIIQIGQVWWPTMEMEKFPNSTFRDVFFSYVPGREEDFFII